MDLIQNLKKVELHEHLDGSLNVSTIIDLARRDNIELPYYDETSLASYFDMTSKKADLSAYLDKFQYTIAVMQTKENLERVAYEHLKSLVDDNIEYTEIRFAPILHTKKGLSCEEVIESVLSGLERAHMETGIDFGLILCAMRTDSPSVTQKTASLCIRYKDFGVVGYDLAGQEVGHLASQHKKACDILYDEGIHLTIHAGEAAGIESIRDAIEICHADRIGHGTRLIDDKDGKLADYIRDHRIGIEMCLSSNLQTQAVNSFSEHPFGTFLRDGFNVFLCTDNRLMSNTTLNKEFAIAQDTFDLTDKELELICRNARSATFKD